MQTLRSSTILMGLLTLSLSAVACGDDDDSDHMGEPEGPEGPKGDDGEEGPEGPEGPQGEKGEMGATIEAASAERRPGVRKSSL